jgi:hypothetical protein
MLVGKINRIGSDRCASIEFIQNTSKKKKQPGILKVHLVKQIEEMVMT